MLGAARRRDVRRNRSVFIHAVWCPMNGGGYFIMTELFGKLKVSRKNGKFWVCECECGNIVLLTKEEITNGHGCAQACLSSRGEICAADLFNELGVVYQVQKKFDDFDLRFDFYLPGFNVVIECDGAQHFRTLNSEWNSEFKLQERLKKPSELWIILQHTDYLVTGPFIQEEKDLTLKWRGSRNQKVIELKDGKKVSEC